ncbi:amidohydrolase [Spirochaeta cellobiosiphila]|uniref:amidohydrolase n=1 Tax=Spirochaeta cellobiosiphila TaxID=504483 RepID=UPI00040DEAB7|nr:amidohydrolase [Spirochaeta cellobiosiphila]
MDKKSILDWLEEQSADIFKLSDQLWDFPELKYQENYAVEQICPILEENGFIVEQNLANISTAFKGTYGSGYPVIGILGEYDALAGMSQLAGSFEKKKDPTMENGHGCGHNLLGSGSLLAALGIKKFLENNPNSGTVVFFGCPAEEGGAGKTFMVKDGVFDDVDIALSWHPSDYNAVSSGTSLANMQILYKFYGTSAHAAAVPHLGRSALDAVELMNVGCNYLREHVVSNARIHYAITDSGGNMPGIVQPYAEVLYLIRAPKLKDVRDIKKRLDKIADGAALMTETLCEKVFVKATSNIIPNDFLGQLLFEKMQQIPFGEITEQELNEGIQWQKSMKEMVNSLEGVVERADSKDKAWIREKYGLPVNDFIIPFTPNNICQAYSTDVGDVSWICPTGQIAGLTWIANSMEHTWQVVAQGKSTLAHKGIIYAAKVLAMTGISLIENHKLVDYAKAELKERCQDEKYISPIP